MLRVTAEVNTPDASRYMQALCRHFKKKVKSECDAHSGRVDFNPGVCRMTASGERTLSIVCEAENAEAMERVKFIVGEHVRLLGRHAKLDVTWDQ